MASASTSAESNPAQPESIVPPIAAPGSGLSVSDATPAIGKHWQTKEQTARYFQFSVRSITHLMQLSILPYTKLGSLVRFERVDCDRALEAFKTRAYLPQGAVEGASLRDRTAPRNWRTKAQIARHFQISLRTVTNMMAKKFLPYVKIGNLVRFDLAECDELLQRCKHLSRFRDWETGSRGN